MVEQLQVALGLQEAVRRWCWSQPPQPTDTASHPAGIEQFGEAGLSFLQQLLLLGSLEGAEAPPIPSHLFLEEVGDRHDGRSSIPPDDAALLPTPHSCGGLTSHRHRSGLESSAFNGAALQDARTPGVHSPQASSHVSCYPDESRAPAFARSSEAAAAATPQGLPHGEDLGFADPVQQQGLQDLSTGLAEPQAVSCSESIPSKYLERAAQSRDVVSPPAAGALGAEEQPKNPQQQRRSQLVRQPKHAAAKTNKEKGIKRRPEQQGHLQVAPRGLSVASPAASSPEASGPPLQVVGGPVARAEGPPQKRQAVGRRRGETAVGARSSSSSNLSSSSSRGKAAGGRLPTKMPTVARCSSAGVPQGSGCRLSPSAKEGSSDVEGAEGAAAAAAVAAAHSSSCSSGAEAAVHAFAAEWLRGCQQRLEAFGGKVREESVAGSSSGTREHGDAPPHSSPPSSPFKTLENLQLTKKQLKQELRAYNTAFAAHFGRQPLKQDKEPLRPVYMHYQRIKQRLEQLLEAPETGRPPGAAAGTAAAAESSSAAEASQPEVFSSPTCTRSNTADISSPPGVPSPTGGAKRLRRHHSVRSLETLSPKAVHRAGLNGGAPRSPEKAKEKQASKQIAKPSAFERQQLLQRRREEMALQLHQLQRERRLLGDKLAAYHLQFKQEHGRPLRLKADIAPVHEEYKLFVEITKQIDALAFALQKQTLS
ncbi:hypothetical protein, conserved [Eimeria praecox]|uniref:FAM13A-like domain-containing protein n=1 Tax=Eimeria praecox TaxID=51316 RepID=U6G2M0_9EIME|nr:hypothetical protein, conserved [Eimeria praecox]